MARPVSFALCAVSFALAGCGGGGGAGSGPSGIESGSGRTGSAEIVVTWPDGRSSEIYNSVRAEVSDRGCRKRTECFLARRQGPFPGWC